MGAAGIEIKFVSALVHGSLQGLAGFELGYVGGRDLDPFARPGVAARRSGPVSNAEGTEANETNFRTTRK